MSNLFDDRDVPSETKIDRVISSELPFTLIPNVIMRKFGTDLGPIGVAVYLTIKSYANYKNDSCFLLINTIASELGMCEKTVRVNIAKLESLGLLEKALRTGKSSVYKITEVRYLIPDTPVPDTGHPGIKYRHNNTLLSNTLLTGESVAEIPLQDGSNFSVPQQLFEEYKSAYPGVSIMDEFNQMRSWLISNPERKKTRKGITRFMNSWLSRARTQLPPQKKTQDPHDILRSQGIQI